MAPRTKNFKRLIKGNDKTSPSTSSSSQLQSSSSSSQLQSSSSSSQLQSSSSSKKTPESSKTIQSNSNSQGRNLSLSSNLVTEVRKVILIEGQLKKPCGREGLRDDEQSDVESDQLSIEKVINTPHSENEVQYENDFSFQDLSDLKIPLLIGSLKDKPYKIREHILQKDLLINVVSAKQLLGSRSLFNVLQRKRDPKIYYKEDKNSKVINISAHYYLVKHMFYNLFCDHGFVLVNPYDVAVNDLSDPQKWDDGPVLSKNLTNIFLSDPYLRTLLVRDHGHIKDWAKKRSKIILPSLKSLNEHIDLNLEIITRPV